MRIENFRTFIRRAAWAVAACAVLAGLCGSAAFASFSLFAAPVPRQYIEGDNALPWKSLTDWVSYSDVVAKVKITAEHSTQLSAEEQAAGEGLKIRLVDATVTSVLWKSSSAHDLPAAITFPHGAWSVNTKRGQTRLYLEDAADLVIGHTYLVPLTYEPAGVLHWQGLGPEDILPMDDRVGDGETILGPSGTPMDWLSDPTDARAALWHQSSDRVSALLAATPIDSFAGSHLYLPAVDRYRAAVAAGAVGAEIRQ